MVSDRMLPPRPTWLSPPLYRRLCYLSVPCLAIGREQALFRNPVLPEELTSLPPLPHAKNRRPCALLPLYRETGEEEPRFALYYEKADVRYLFYPHSLTGITAGLAARDTVALPLLAAIPDGYLRGSFTHAAEACQGLFALSPYHETAVPCQRLLSVWEATLDLLRLGDSITVIGRRETVFLQPDKVAYAIGASAEHLHRHPDTEPILQIGPDHATLILGTRTVSLGTVGVPPSGRPRPFFFHRTLPTMVQLLSLAIEFGFSAFDYEAQKEKNEGLLHPVT